MGDTRGSQYVQVSSLSTRSIVHTLRTAHACHVTDHCILRDPLIPLAHCVVSATRLLPVIKAADSSGTRTFRRQLRSSFPGHELRYLGSAGFHKHCVALEVTGLTSSATSFPSLSSSHQFLPRFPPRFAIQAPRTVAANEPTMQILPASSTSSHPALHACFSFWHRDTHVLAIEDD